MLEKSKVSNRDETAGGSGATSSNNPHARGWSTIGYPLRAFLPNYSLPKSTILDALVCNSCAFEIDI